MPLALDPKYKTYVGQGLDIGFPKFKYEDDMGCQLDPVVKIGFVSMSGGRKRLDSRVVGLGISGQ
jgi:hypothetical protein